MTKKQKILLGIFGAMFLIPEILWGMVSNFSYGMFYTGYLSGGSPSEFHLLPLIESNAFNLFILFVQFVGILLSFICLFIIKFNRKFTKWVTVLFFSIILFLTFYTFLFALNFNPQFG